ncbi:hypothetical protein [Paenibacillus flagellatus]|uniref:ABC transporter permease n=1 Tax=Paenibacillus flagellatus TaxID=2211139 RepID=A0A2V5K8B9_9BACL|nr:hypothetical protein [Paenibacillus flagellatus]PYI55755.1 hypothetical protein DLM86_08530 [Paenibacillus flagellatus]
MRSACRIAWFELKGRLVPLVLTSLMAAVNGYMLGSEITAYLSGAGTKPIFFSSFYAMDWMLVAVLPLLGTIPFTKEYLSWSSFMDEPFLKRLRFYRMWAIPLGVVAWSRIVYALVCLAASQLGFVAALAVSGWSAMTEYGNVWTLVSYALVWFGYSAALCGINPYLESGTNAKIVLAGTFGILVLSAGAAAAFRLLLGEPLFVWLLRAVRADAFVPAALAVAAGIAGLLLFRLALGRRLARNE